MKFDQVFIITYGRSGSTLLQRVLNSIDGCVVRGENNNALFHIFRSVKFVSEGKERFGVGKGSIEGLESENDSNPWYGIGSIDEKQFQKDLVSGFVRNIIRPPEGCKAYGFKEIRYFDHPYMFREYLDFMKCVFSNPCFVFNTRAWDDVCKSGFWAKKDKEWMRERLGLFENTMNEFCRENPDRSYAISYEDYKDDSSAFRGMFEFLGEEFDQAQVSEVLESKLKH